MDNVYIKYWDKIKNNSIFIILFFLTTAVISYSVIKKSVNETKSNAKDIIKLIKVLNDSTESGKSVLVYKKNQLNENSKEIYPKLNFFVMNSFDSIKTIPYTKYYKAYINDKISFLDEQFNKLSNDNYKLIKEDYLYFTIEVKGEKVYLNHDLLRVKPQSTTDDSNISEYILNKKRVFKTKVNKLWGMKDENNKIILPFIYEEINVLEVRDYVDGVKDANSSLPQDKIKKYSRLRFDVIYNESDHKYSISNYAVFKRKEGYGIVDITVQKEIFGPLKCNAIIINNRNDVNKDIVLINTGVINKKYDNVSIGESIYEVENTKWSYYSISKKQKLFNREFKTATFFDENNRALVNRSENTVELIDNTGKSYGLINDFYDGK